MRFGELGQQLEGEITASTEWVKFDGDSVSFIPGGWTSVIEDCLEASHHPIMLFFETSEHGGPPIMTTDRFKVKKEHMAGLQISA